MQTMEPSLLIQPVKDAIILREVGNKPIRRDGADKSEKTLEDETTGKHERTRQSQNDYAKLRKIVEKTSRGQL